MEYKASILNITKNQWVKDETDGKVRHTARKRNRLLFYDEFDAESTLGFLNDNYLDCYTLILESGSDKYWVKDKIKIIHKPK